jgi:hypothetical protein
MTTQCHILEEHSLKFYFLDNITSHVIRLVADLYRILLPIAHDRAEGLSVDFRLCINVYPVTESLGC